MQNTTEAQSTETKTVEPQPYTSTDSVREQYMKRLKERSKARYVTNGTYSTGPSFHPGNHE